MFQDVYSSKVWIVFLVNDDILYKNVCAIFSCGTSTKAHMALAQ